MSGAAGLTSREKKAVSQCDGFWRPCLRYVVLSLVCRKRCMPAEDENPKAAGNISDPKDAAVTSARIVRKAAIGSRLRNELAMQMPRGRGQRVPVSSGDGTSTGLMSTATLQLDRRVMSDARRDCHSLAILVKDMGTCKAGCDQRKDLLEHPKRNFKRNAIPCGTGAH